MGTFILLTAEAIEEPGIGLNFDILETNLINLVIIIGVLVYFGRGFLGKTLADRKARIEEAIKDAETRKKEAAAALADEQQKLVTAELRQRIAALALQQVESQLKSGIGDATQQQLIDRSIATIGGPS
jgi:F-type H+-transporting ATPase subunit b